MAQCANENCFCETSSADSVRHDDREYCSEFCASSEGASLEDCECGHPDCEPE